MGKFIWIDLVTTIRRRRNGGNTAKSIENARACGRPPPRRSSPLSTIAIASSATRQRHAVTTRADLLCVPASRGAGMTIRVDKDPEPCPYKSSNHHRELPWLTDGKDLLARQVSASFDKIKGIPRKAISARRSIRRHSRSRYFNTRTSGHPECRKISVLKCVLRITTIRPRGACLLPLQDQGRTSRCTRLRRRPFDVSALEIGDGFFRGEATTANLPRL